MPAKKKSAPRGTKKRKKKPSPKTRLGTEIKKALLGVLILALMVVAAGVAARFVLGPGGSGPGSPLPPPEPSKPAAPQRAVAHKVPKFEIYPADVPQPAPKPAPAETGVPKAAIIIDDMGYDRRIADRFCALDAPLTFSVLPFCPFRDAVVQKARSRGFVLMLHLPMEPNEYPEVDPGPGALLTSMDPDLLLKTLESDLDAVPYAAGVNNHMGSRLSAQSNQMNQIFTVLKRRRLFYVDSRTTWHTKARQAARLLQVPFAQRDVFLDHDPAPRAIRGQIRELIATAVRHGEAVGIGHPHAETLDALREMLPELKARVRLVPITELVHPVS